MDASEFEGRLSAVEQKVLELDGRVRATAQDAAAARVLAGAADRDVSEFRAELTDFRRATTASFNALREDVTEGFAEMRGKLDATAAGQQQIAALIQQVIEKDE